MGPSLDQPQHAKLCCGPPCAAISKNMLHLARQLAPFPPILLLNRMAWLWSGRGTLSPIGQTVQMLPWQFRAGLTSWASPTESVGMPSTGRPKAGQGRFSMAARCEWHGHPDPDGPATKASVPETSAVLDSYVEASATPLSIRSAPFSQGRSHLGFPD